ncbi:MAG: hypothetical protein ACHRHE_11240 [Tepidisphaerales bacterium]
MGVPERYWRFRTKAATDALATRFGLPNEPNMQDWPWEVADFSRLPELLAALEGGDLTDDERFTLSETVMQCFENLADEGRAVSDISNMDEWQRFVLLLRARPALHAHTLCYWSSPDAFDITPLVRPLWAEIEPLLRHAE